jgi:HK97 family phage major capsid protein
MELRAEARRLSAIGTPAAIAESHALRDMAKTICEVTHCSQKESMEKYTLSLGKQIAAEAGKNIPEERYKRVWEKAMAYGDEGLSAPERRDLLAGQQTVSWTSGNTGGYEIPIEYETQVFESVAEVGELLDPAVCDFTVGDSPYLRPRILTGYDLTTVEASQVLETQQQTAGAFPNANSTILRGNIVYRITFAASVEAAGTDGDSGDIPQALAKVSRAAGVGFGRRLESDAVLGNGTSMPGGILDGAGNYVYYTGAGKVTNNDINSIVYSVNRVYRKSKFCSWLMSETVLERIREATDSQNRPLINVVDGENILAGFPIHICPALGVVGGSLGLNSSVIFGDLSHFHVRCSKPTIQRVTNSANTIEYGKILYVARIRMDSILFNPAGISSSQPVVAAQITA